jgi:hypothetical protein
MKKLLFVSMALGLLAGASLSAMAQTTGSVSKAEQTSAATYSDEEIVTAGHQFFGKASRDLAEAVQYVFRKQGEPTAYIVGEEAAGSFVGGLRYGEGTIYYKNGIKQRIYWQGPSVGFDSARMARAASCSSTIPKAPRTSTAASPALRAAPISSAVWA